MSVIYNQQYNKVAMINEYKETKIKYNTRLTPVTHKQEVKLSVLT